ncbi:hypothetical protein OBA44_00705 [Bacteroidota bacterium]|jgi:hypothetical protein|nr:hypothetical protein [Balneola sp.]MCH1552939.1 hypothetical protein [Balneolaceae bacterium]MDC3136073.1 hypothetical protein [Bacteroidota bacterium]OUX48940.1 MAG: hypothetical protein CBE44_00465 [Bacteroidetes bacterium TMED284]PDH54942.1 MAG: hypothetical protein CNE38_05020 [Rhodothermaeota bacterium MED-G12]|tara:strand:- start:6418 stop:6894 length:477 start_codon:yes stop_codon:yes gene_type:complete
MNIDTRNKILSAVFGITIILLSWLLYDSIVTPYKVVEEQKAETERVRTRMLTLKDAIVNYEARYGHFPPTDGGLDSVVTYLSTDSLMISMGDSLFRQMPPLQYSPESMVVSPRDTSLRFLYTRNDTIRPPLYLLEDPMTDDAVGSLSRTTMRNAPNWN